MKARVAILGTVGKSLLIDTNATNGATIGTNLFLDDGSVPTLEQLRALLGSGEQPSFANTVWKLIQEIPANVKEVEELASSGLVVRKVAGDWITRSLAIEADGLLQLANPAGEAGNPTLGAADIAALSVWGRSANTAGKPAPITAAADTTLLRRSGTSVGFGTITSAYVSDFAERAQDEVFGAIADSARIDFAYDDALNAFTADLISASVANSFLADMAQATIKGRAAAAGTGVPTDLSGAQVATIIGYTAADVLAKLITVDGAGSLIDADFLDGLSSAAFATAVHSHAIADVTGLTAALALKLDASSYTAADVLAKLITVDGSGSGIDADLLDGISSVGFLQVSTYEALAPTWTQLHTYGANILLESAHPRLLIQETGLAADTGMWDWDFDAGTAALRTRTDADGAGVGVLAITRPSGTQPLRLFTGALDADLAGFSTAAGNVNNYTVVFSAFDLTRNANFALVSSQRPLFNMLKYAGTLTSPTQITNNTALSLFAFACYNTDTAAIAPSAAIATTSTENWSATAQGTRMDLSSTPNGTLTRSIVLRLAELQIQSLDGTAAAPSKTYQSDLDSGEYRIGANQVGIATNATLGFAVDATQRIYGTALHNNASSPTGTTNQYVASGTYTPTLNNTTNVAASTASQCQWMRVGNVVTVSGRASVDPTAAGATVLGISLPLASNLGAVEDCAGAACSSGIAGQCASIHGDAANDRAVMEWIAVDITNQPMYFTFTYEII